MFITSYRTKCLHNLPTAISIDKSKISFKQSVNNCGYVLYYNLTVNGHVSTIARKGHFELRRLASIRRFLTSTATATLVSVMIDCNDDL